MAMLFLTPINATYISQLNPNQNFGPTESLLLGRTATTNDIYRFMLQFNTDFIPSGNIITNATLRLYLVGKRSPIIQPLNVRTLLSSFSQNSVTYNTAPVFGPQQDSTLLSNPNFDNYIYVNMPQLVQQWYTGTTPNYGIGLTTDETQPSFLTFYGYEDGTVALWPTLIVEYIQAV